MKDRIKQFCKDHEDKLAVIQTVAGLTTVAIATHILFKERGNRIDGVWSDDDVPGGTKIFVDFKNGSTRSYTKPTQ